MYKIENGEIIKEQSVGGLQEVIAELETLSLKKSTLTAHYHRAKENFDTVVPSLEAQITSLIDKAKQIQVPDDLSDECIAKLQEFNIL